MYQYTQEQQAMITALRTVPNNSIWATGIYTALDSLNPDKLTQLITSLQSQCLDQEEIMHEILGDTAYEAVKDYVGPYTVTFKHEQTWKS